MTNTQKALRGVGNVSLTEVKRKVQNRLKKSPTYRDRFRNKQARNLAASSARIDARAAAAKAKTVTA